MNSKLITIIIITLALNSCNFLKHGISFAPEDRDRKIFHTNAAVSDSHHIVSVECDEFVSNALSNYTIALISKVFIQLNCTKETVINMHDSSVIDTVYTFSDSNNKIQVYRSRQKDFIIMFDVTDSKYILSGNVNTGITKELFAQKFQIDGSIGDKIVVVNSDNTMKFNFYFMKNKLKRIKSDLYLD